MNLFTFIKKRQINIKNEYELNDQRWVLLLLEGKQLFSLLLMVSFPANRPNPC